MSQTYTDNLYSISMQASTTLQAMKDNFAALKSAFSGTSTPSNPVGGMPWLDTTNHLYKLRNEDNSAWLSLWDMANNKPILANANITELPAATAWRLFYANGSKVITELPLGTIGQFLRSGGAAAPPYFSSSISGSDLADGSITGAKLLAAVAGTEIYLAKAMTSRTTNATSYTKVKQTEPLLRGGTVTVTFTLASVIDTVTVYGRVYKNGSAVGTARSTNTSETFQESLLFAVGDVVQVYAYTGNGSYAVFVSNLSVMANDPYCAREATGY